MRSCPRWLVRLNEQPQTKTPGDQISYYIKVTPKKVAAYEAAKLASDFDPQNRDENVDYYVAKLDELVKEVRWSNSRSGGAEAGELGSLIRKPQNHEEQSNIGHLDD